MKENRACSTCAPRRPGSRSQCLNRISSPAVASSQPIPFSAVASMQPRSFSQPSLGAFLEKSISEPSSILIEDEPHSLHSNPTQMSTPTATPRAPATDGSPDPESRPQGTKCNDDFLRTTFERAFGAPLVNGDGGPDSDIRKLWWKTVELRGKQYELPNGNFGKRFVNILAEEIERCTAGRQPSEREFVFTALILQRDRMVRKAKDIRPPCSDEWICGKPADFLSC